MVGHDETFNAYGNVLVKNLRVIDFFEGIRTPSNNNSFISNRFENTRIHILGGPAGNVLKNNYFINSSVFVDYNYGGHDVITENNFFNSGTLVDLADAPFVDRNYWSNYTIKYPNATQVEGLGIWNTPYVDDRYSWATGRSIDYHPLVNPITDFEIPNFGILAMPTLTPYPTINTGPEPPQTESFPTTIVTAVTLVVVLAVVAGLLVYHKKQHLVLKKNGGARVISPLSEGSNPTPYTSKKVCILSIPVNELPIPTRFKLRLIIHNVEFFPVFQ